MLLQSLGLPKGEWVLCIGAESAYDKETIAYVHHLGGKIACIVRDNDTKKELEGYGADAVSTALCQYWILCSNTPSVVCPLNMLGVPETQVLEVAFLNT